MNRIFYSYFIYAFHETMVYESKQTTKSKPFWPKKKSIINFESGNGSYSNEKETQQQQHLYRLFDAQHY